MKTAVLTIEKLVHGGQGLAHDPEGRAVFVWGALPGETVAVRYTRVKKDWADAITVEVHQSSPQRIDPLENDIYLSTSPWQILSYEDENTQKDSILQETFHGINLEWSNFYAPGLRYGYRNKMEYNFWFDTVTHTLSLALHQRASHFKISVTGSALAMESINMAGHSIITALNRHQIGGRQLKSLIIRSNREGLVEAVLYVTDRTVADISWSDELSCGITVVYSDHKSPASVVTERLDGYDKKILTDMVAGREFTYSPEGFFQVNIPVYEETIKDIDDFVGHDDIVDMYAGVGSIGMSLDYASLISVELDPESHEQAKLNAQSLSNVEVVLSGAEDALEYIKSEKVLIVDPPRAGLHKDVTATICKTRPKKIVYLSCNPSTQARDIVHIINSGYRAVFCRGYNYFPATPHIESLIMLERIDKKV